MRLANIKFLIEVTARKQKKNPQIYSSECHIETHNEGSKVDIASFQEDTSQQWLETTLVRSNLTCSH